MVPTLLAVESTVSAEEGAGWVRCGFSRNGDGGKDLEEERGRRSRQVDVPVLSRSAGRGRDGFGDEDGQCGQGKTLPEGAVGEWRGPRGGNGEPLKVLSERMD